MGYLKQIFRHNLALVTDLYELTMAQGFYRAGFKEAKAIFNLFFRKNPFNNGYTIAVGNTFLIEYLCDLKFDAEDIEYLKTLKTLTGKPLFEEDFLNYLSNFKFSCDVDAVPEGSVVFPFEPILKVKGNLIEAQIIESAILNIINFHSLIATKAARVCISAGGDPVIEFGLRRAQGFYGAIGASFSAYVGGCEGTSNLLAGKLFGIPVRGTHAHSWVLCFDNELEAFSAYARAMPENCIFLVDTYNTIEGVKQAIKVGNNLKKCGHKLLGIRIDSGDLAALSKKARKLLDSNGFKETKIVGSGDLDEHLITELKKRGAKIDIWGVGTKLATGYNEPFLSGVYKLAAIDKTGHKTEYKMKLSEDYTKPSIPGNLNIKRFIHKNKYVCDIIYDIDTGFTDNTYLFDISHPSKKIKMPEYNFSIDLLIPIIKNGKPVIEPDPPQKIREFVKNELEKIDKNIKSLTSPKKYIVGLNDSLASIITNLSH